ncbi:hypothetical protein GQ600_1815 [Phytophthora cactorum]|nr:hypothetical protein GQ600_1815 [Phytophthora cactorum]
MTALPATITAISVTVPRPQTRRCSGLAANRPRIGSTLLRTRRLRCRMLDAAYPLDVGGALSQPELHRLVKQHVPPLSIFAPGRTLLIETER